MNKKTSLFLHRIRKRHHLSGKEMARLLNVSQQQISRYESGKTQLTLNLVSSYLKIFNIDWEDFINEVKNQK